VATTLDVTILSFENWQVPTVLRIGCSHPAATEVTTFADEHRSYICFGCGARWKEVETRA